MVSASVQATEGAERYRDRQQVNVRIAVKGVEEKKESRDHRIPESRNAFCSIVSLTAANTKRMLPVSVAWVKLKHRYKSVKALFKSRRQNFNSLRVDAQPRPIELRKSPQNVLGSFIDVRSSRIFREVLFQCDFW